MSLKIFDPQVIFRIMDRDQAIERLSRFNLRDLARLPEQTHVLTPYSYYRCGALRHMNSKEREAFASLGVKTVIDLRTYVERRNKPDDPLPGVNVLHIPLLKEETMGITHGRGVFAYGAPPDMRVLYAGLVTNPESIEALKQVMDVIFDPKREGAIAWHCTAGKDRAGLVTALFLYAIGASEEEILEDYVKSNATSEPKGRTYRRLIRLLMWNKPLSEAVYKTMLAVPEYLLSAFDAIKESWGDVKTFLRDALGVGEDRVAAFLSRQK